MTYDWTAQLPAQERKCSTYVYSTIEALVGFAHLRQDADLFVPVAAAWSLCGYAPQWLAQPLSGPSDYDFVEGALRGRNRRKIRNEGIGLLRALEALEAVGILGALTSHDISQVVYEEREAAKG